jgi:hypothetical protein
MISPSRGGIIRLDFFYQFANFAILAHGSDNPVNGAAAQSAIGALLRFLHVPLRRWRLVT